MDTSWVIICPLSKGMEQFILFVIMQNASMHIRIAYLSIEYYLLVPTRQVCIVMNSRFHACAIQDWLVGSTLWSSLINPPLLATLWMCFFL